VLNKSVDPEAEVAWLGPEFGPGTLLGVIPYDPHIAATDRAGVSLLDSGYDSLLTPFRVILQNLTEGVKR